MYFLLSCCAPAVLCCRWNVTGSRQVSTSSSTRAKFPRGTQRFLEHIFTPRFCSNLQLKVAIHQASSQHCVSFRVTSRYIAAQWRHTRCWCRDVVARRLMTWHDKSQPRLQLRRHLESRVRLLSLRRWVIECLVTMAWDWSLQQQRSWVARCYPNNNRSPISSPTQHHNFSTLNILFHELSW